MEFRCIVLITLLLAMSCFVIAIAVRIIEAAICIEPNRRLMMVAKTFFVGSICLGTLSLLLFFACTINKLI